VETQPVIDHLRHLSAQGVGYKAVCEAAGVGKSSIMKIMLGRRTQMRAANARAILAVTPEMAIRDGAVISAKATWRHIRWLLSEGMTREEIARRLGYKAKRPSLQIGKHTVRASTAMKVEQLVGRMRIGE
jgi:transcriptional regulator with XRE-family HTH domain